MLKAIKSRHVSPNLHQIPLGCLLFMSFSPFCPTLLKFISSSALIFWYATSFNERERERERERARGGGKKIKKKEKDVQYGIQQNLP